ncbi:CLUMA_CG020368, isoform A [Clunio marinus]|uniref:CLUMA_CG020368, isoform A n=1 Tax=Clunio marinus TaxID=568069 RepID=A0A1J1J4R6_9DIPT|nr:CLUMA_CG020368, isoform A [Clunio marinus]
MVNNTSEGKTGDQRKETNLDPNVGTNKKKIVFSCEEIEAKTRNNHVKEDSILKISSQKVDLKRIDPAVMYYSSPNNVTRYDKDELMSLKSTFSAQSPPSCLYDPRIIRLNILKYKQVHPEEYENQMKAFRGLLPRLSMSSFDPKLLDLLNNYHRSLLLPCFQNYTGGKINDINNLRQSQRNNNQMPNSRNVSWIDEKPYFDNHNEELPYDRKNFFDNITTTASGLRTSRVGSGWLDNKKVRQPLQDIRSAKINSCSNERFNYHPGNHSIGSISTYSESKSSCDDSLNKSSEKDESGFSNKLMSADDKSDNGNMESEPEWFSWPASRNDVIDLHGFEEDEELNKSNESKATSQSSSQKCSPTKTKFEDFQGAARTEGCPSVPVYRRTTQHDQFNQHQQRSNRTSISKPSNYAKSNLTSSGFYNTTHNRQAMHHFKTQPVMQRNDVNQSAKSEAESAAHINPFFEMWKKNLSTFQQENVNYAKIKSEAQMITITDVENAMNVKMGNLSHQEMPKPSSSHNENNRFKMPAVSQMSGTNVLSMGAGSPNFQKPFPPFMLGQSSVPPHAYQPGMIPSQEQLQQHTSEIMRNAIIRKQLGEEKKFRK